MGRRGDGYGSEDQLLRYLAEAQSEFNAAVAPAIGVATDQIRWLPLPRRSDGTTREFLGLEFLDQPQHGEVRERWRSFWPQTGHKHGWDAIGMVGRRYLLVEAKANHPEFCTPPTRPRSPESLRLITASLGRVRRDLGVHRHFDWTGTYYQYANRLAALWFLRREGIEADLLFVYFHGERFPDGTPCPTAPGDWKALLEARRLTLGLPSEHNLRDYEHTVFLPARTPA